MRAAVIGIGSNSVRMLVAEAADGEIRRISRDRAGTRLFAGLDEAGNLSREAMASSCAAVKRMADSARSQGAEKSASLCHKRHARRRQQRGFRGAAQSRNRLDARNLLRR